MSKEDTVITVDSADQEAYLNTALSPYEQAEEKVVSVSKIMLAKLLEDCPDVLELARRGGVTLAELEAMQYGSRTLDAEDNKQHFHPNHTPGEQELKNEHFEESRVIFNEHPECN